MDEIPTSNNAGQKLLPLFKNERRSGTARMNLSDTFVFSNFGSNRLFSEHQSRFNNQSEVGACFDDKQKYPPGTILFIRSNAHPVGGYTGENHPRRNTSLAEVRWCEPVETEGRDASYKIGIKYL